MKSKKQHEPSGEKWVGQILGKIKNFYLKIQRFFEAHSNYKTFDIAIIILTLFILLFPICYVPSLTDYLSDSISGMTTIASVLTGLIVFFINHSFSTIEKRLIKVEIIESHEKIKEKVYEEMRDRAFLSICVLGVCLGAIVVAYMSMGEGNIVNAFRVTLGCLIVIIMLFMETSLLLVVRYEIEIVETVEVKK